MKRVQTAGRLITALLIAWSLGPLALAERTPVLRQIKVPHDYYFREMYLPQVSSGPQSPAWSPDGQTLVYSMQGSLWRQPLGSGTATQLTAGPGYDHQPDWSPDGRSIVFTRYLDDAMELQLLDTATGAVTPLTSGGDVNLEPRWSPDGTRLAFVSTAGSGRFHVFTGKLQEGQLQASPLFDERKSRVQRYYYSEYDHEINPTWSPDGRSLLFVANAEIPYGSGAIWHYVLDADAKASLVRQEETTWRARPDIAPDGRRVIYASYLGRQWHQLWITSIGAKGEPFPLTYGDYDVSSARWSPQGDRIAYAVNESGNTALRVLQVPGGKVSNVAIAARRYLRPTGSVLLSVTNSNGESGSARVSLVGADGRSYAPHDRWMHADDSFDRSQRSEEARYFHAYGAARIDLPEGRAQVTVWQGLESHIERHEIEVKANSESDVRIKSAPLDLPPEWQHWHSGDVHVHMNYGGIYRNTPANLIRQAEAEDLDLVFNLIVNKEQRIPDIRYFSGRADAASNRRVVLQHSQEFHTGYWGHLGLLALTDHLLLPDYSAYPETAAASLYPDNATVEDMAHEQGAIAGYVHTFVYPVPDPDTDASLTNALPVDAALGKVDYYEVVGFADHRAAADVWYRLLNCGFRIAAAGGTDAMANFASLRGPVGINRTYVQTEHWPADPDLRRDIWIQNLQAGKSIATNGPLIGLSVDGQGPGSILQSDAALRISYRGFLRSMVPIDQLELVLDGNVIRTVELAPNSMSADFDGSLNIDKSGWLLLRASSRDPHPDIFDMYPYATTSPIYVDIGDTGPLSTRDADYFLAWIERARIAAAAHTDFNSTYERQQVLQHIEEAAGVFRRRRSR